jgi:hypothetical protein
LPLNGAAGDRPAMPDWLDISDSGARVAYTATSGQTVFTVPFPFLDEGDLEVYQNGTLKTLSTHYTTSGAEEEDGGTITLVTGATLNDSIIIARVLPYELTTHIPPSGPLDIPAINLQFSRFMMILQQLDDNLVRSIKQPTADAEEMDDLPAAASRAQKYLYFDADGNPTAVSAVSTSVAASAFILTLLDDTTAAAARTTLGITDQTAYSGLSNWHWCQ